VPVPVTETVVGMVKESAELDVPVTVNLLAVPVLPANEDTPPVAPSVPAASAVTVIAPAVPDGAIDPNSMDALEVIAIGAVTVTLVAEVAVTCAFTVLTANVVAMATAAKITKRLMEFVISFSSFFYLKYKQ